jgi:phage terminase small subunit
MNAAQKFLFDQLTGLQQRVATHVLSGMTQRQAYRLAGGSADSDESADSAASTMLSNGKVAAFMDAMKDEAVSEAIMSRKEAMEKLTILARTDLKDLVDFGSYEVGTDAESGNPVIQATWKVKPQAMQDPRQMAAISELTAGRDGIKIKTHSPMEAIKQLAKMQGWETPQKIDHTSSDGSMSPKGKSLDDFYAASDVSTKPGA